MTATPAIEGWFTLGDQPTLLGERCTSCATTYFPPTAAAAGFCRNPACEGQDFESVPLSRRGTVWSYTDAQRPACALMARRRPSHATGRG